MSGHWLTPAAVTHETIIPVVREVRQEVITREIHNHDVYHRIQPVIDREVLPTKHYLQDERGHMREIPADKIPEGSSVVAKWQTAHWEAQTGSLKPAPPDDPVGTSRNSPPPRKYPKVGKFAKKHQPDVSERFDQRPSQNPPLPDDDVSRSYGSSPPKSKFLTTDERPRARLDKVEGLYSTLERGDRGRKATSIHSMSPSRASSTTSVRSKASSLHVREFSEH